MPRWMDGEWRGVNGWVDGLLHGSPATELRRANETIRVVRTKGHLHVYLIKGRRQQCMDHAQWNNTFPNTSVPLFFCWMASDGAV